MLTRRILLLLLGASGATAATQTARYVAVDEPSVLPPRDDGPPPPAEEYPGRLIMEWPWTIQAPETAGRGTSTMAGGEPGSPRFPSPMKAIQLSTTGGTYYAPFQNPPGQGGGTMLANRGVRSGGTLQSTLNSITTDQALNPRLTNCAQIILCAPADSDALTDGIETGLAFVRRFHDTLGGDASRVLIVRKHNAIGVNHASGGIEHWRTAAFCRALIEAGYVTSDPQLQIRHWDTGVPGDRIQQERDELPPSYDSGDQLHALGTYHQVLADRVYLPWLKTYQDPSIPFIGYQTRYSQSSTNQVLDGLVCELVSTGDFSKTTFAVDDPNFRATGTFLDKLNHLITITFDTLGTHVIDGRRRDVVFRQNVRVRVFLQSMQDTAPYRAVLNRQALACEWREPQQDSNAVTVCMALDPLPGFDAAVANTAGGIHLVNHGNLSLFVNQVHGHVTLALRNPLRGTVMQLSTPGAFFERFGRQWIWFWADFTNGADNGHGWAMENAGGLMTGVNSGLGGTIVAPSLAPFRMFNNDGRMQYLFSLARSPSAPYEPTNTGPLARVAMWMAMGKVDCGVEANRALFRDPVTRRSVLNTQRGADAPGVVAGVSPYYWNEGPAANLSLNLARPRQHWEVMERTTMAIQATALA